MSEQFDWNNYERTELYFLEKAQQNLHDPYELHFVYNGFIKLYFKHRNTALDSEEKLILICQLDIDLFPDFREAWFTQNPTYNFLPRIPSFQKLIQIYERKHRIDEAIVICKLAIHYDLDDGTKGGFTGRLQKLEKKLLISQ
ncbi:hypothetical protein [Paenibacillus lactis]|uniref:hypothetical protein n=1 Tax=Paenibacillus lactis TaxID=228574 RepID=UPI003D72E3FB